jgi:hypothetical protein
MKFNTLENPRGRDFFVDLDIDGRTVSKIRSAAMLVCLGGQLCFYSG